MLDNSNVPSSKDWGHKAGRWFRETIRILLVLATLLVTVTAEAEVTTQSIAVGAPFEMPSISVPDFSNCPEFSIVDFGASHNDEESTTAAISAAIDAAHRSGGGTVVIPAGEWPTRKIHLQSNVNLHLKAEATLLFSENPDHYLPPVATTWEGMECLNYSPLVYAHECENVAITGSGTLRVKLDVFKQWYARPKPHLEALKRLYEMATNGVPLAERNMVGNDANLRPQFVQFNRCQRVLIEGIRIENSPFWVLHPFMCRDVVIRGVEVRARGHNNDGVDTEMCQNVLIEDCLFDQGDDAISIKSGRNHDAWRLDSPSRNIVIRNCRVQHGHQLVAIGSELSGGVENVLVENCDIDENLVGVGHLLYIKTNRRRGGYVRNIYMRGVTAGDLRYGVLGVETDVLYQWRDLVPTHEERLTPIEDIFVADVTAASVEYVSRIDGDVALPVGRVELTDIVVEQCRGACVRNQHVTDFVSNLGQDEGVTAEPTTANGN